MTTDEAREAAWREHVRQIPLLSRMESKSLHVRVTKLGYEAGWGARGEYDKEQIAALVEAATAEDTCQTCHDEEKWHVIDGEPGRCALCEFVCPEFRPKVKLRSALRALAGQSEEATG